MATTSFFGGHHPTTPLLPNVIRVYVTSTPDLEQVVNDLCQVNSSSLQFLLTIRIVLTYSLMSKKLVILC